MKQSDFWMHALMRILALAVLIVGALALSHGA
jgi:hypothetical protein